MNTAGCLPHAKPDDHKRPDHGPILPALSNAMACASGAAVLASGAGMSVAAAAGIAGAVFGFTARYFGARKQ